MVSSDDLAQAAAVKPALVRKDLTRFGQFGIRGVGYEVDSLKAHITRILGLDRDHNIVIMGAGNLGTALADSRGFNTGGFRTLALFDLDPSRIGQETRGGVPILSMKGFPAFIRKKRVEVAVLAVPREAAQRVLDQVASAGIHAVLNFVPATLKSPEGVYTRNVDLKIHLEGLAYRLTRIASGAGGQDEEKASKPARKPTNRKAEKLAGGA